MKHFGEIVASMGTSVNVEYARMKELIEIENYFLDVIGFASGLRTVICRHFRSLPKKLRNGAITFNEYDDIYVRLSQHDYANIGVTDDIDVLISYVEYWYNLIVMLWNNLINDEDIDFSKIRYFAEHVEDLCLRINYEIKDVNGCYYFVPCAAEITLAVQNMPVEIIGDVFTYHHYSYDGDIEHKKDVLVKLAGYLEPQRETLENIDKDLAKSLFGIFNNYGIRHNNVKNQRLLSEMRDDEIEHLYDMTYVLSIEVCLRLDNQLARNSVMGYSKC